MPKVDYIIVGQGLAGSVLAFLLLRKGKKVLVLDNYTEGGKKASSQLAAGVINPITGMRFVKTWRIDAFLSEAQSIYHDIEIFLGVKLWHNRLIHRVLRNTEEENNWLLRNTYADYQPYCGNTPPSVVDLDTDKFKPFYAIAEVKKGAQVNMPLLVSRFRQYFSEKGMMQTTQFDAQKLSISDNIIEYQGTRASKIIFCEGANGKFNPYFNHLPFNPDKGELLLVRIPNLNIRHIFKNKMAIVPLHDTEGGDNDLYWVGATNTWTFENDLPENTRKELIIKELESTLNFPFEVVEHHAAIRPTVKDRRPFIGLHAEQPSLAIFNGFGTKGASLVPFWAAHFVEFLVNGQPLDSAVDILRFR